MMLRHPIAVKAELFGMGGKNGRIGQRFADAFSLNNGDKVQNGKTDHPPHMGG